MSYVEAIPALVDGSDRQSEALGSLRVPSSQSPSNIRFSSNLDGCPRFAAAYLGGNDFFRRFLPAPTQKQM